jgi:carbamoyltransferase
MEDGAIIDCVSEEKFDNVKNSMAFPSKSIEWILQRHGLSIGAIDKVGIVGKSTVFYDIDKDGASQPMESDRKESLLKKAYRLIDTKLDNPFKDRLIEEMQLVKYRKNYPNRKEIFLRQLKERLDLDEHEWEKVEFVDHHDCHAYSAYYGLRQEDRSDALVFTLDGQGDFSCARVYVVRKGQWEKIADTWWKYSIGELYSSLTRILGMKSLEHEYKVMGLAAYSEKRYYEPAKREIFDGLFRLEGLEFRSSIPSYAFDEYLEKRIAYHRFDNLAGAAQAVLEELVLAWISKAIAQTGIKNIYTGGGVFMNVKLNKRIQELSEVESVHFMPSAGDESTPIGAAYSIHKKYEDEPSSFSHIYLGPEYDEKRVETFLNEKADSSRYEIVRFDDIEKKVADLLADSKIVGRFKGRCEWGARSLGNRAILGRPDRMETFFEVNDRIKQRDFWMPFAPTILDQYADRYLFNPKKVRAPYMITAFDATEEGMRTFKAAMHQRDKTLRAQILERRFNPLYYKLIEYFYERTGVGGVMNTSFNLHGYPLAATPQQAWFTFEHSDLEYLAIENFLVRKRDATKSDE